MLYAETLPFEPRIEEKINLTLVVFSFELTFPICFADRWINSYFVLLRHMLIAHHRRFFSASTNNLVVFFLLMNCR